VFLYVLLSVTHVCALYFQLDIHYHLAAPADGKAIGLTAGMDSMIRAMQCTKHRTTNRVNITVYFSNLQHTHP